MPQANYPVYDADRHFYETPDAFLRHLPKAYKNEFQYVQVNNRTKLAVAGQLTEYIPNPTFEVVAAPGSHEQWYRGHNPEGLSLREFTGKPIPSEAAFHDAEAHLSCMDAQGVYGALVLPTLASVIEARMTHAPAVIAALFHSLNQWTVEEVGLARKGRLFPVSMVNLADVDLAVAELEFLLKNGARVVGVRPAPVPGLKGGRSMGFKEFDPFWARVNEAKIFVAMHVSDSGYDQIHRWWTAGATGSTEWRAFEKSAFSEALDQMGRAISDSLAAVICHGVFDRFPNVRVVSLENGSVWLEPLLGRLELAYHKLPKDFARNPIEAFREHIYVSPFFEDPIERIVELIGADRVLFGSDWPHPEGLANPMDYYKDVGSLKPEVIEQIMSSNLKGLLEGVR